MTLTLLLPWLLLAPAAQATAADDPPFVDIHIGSVTLASASSGQAFVSRFPGHVREVDGSLPFVRYVNAANTELLDLVLHPGGQATEFMEFRVRRFRTADAPTAAVASVDAFRTGRGLRLGLTVSEVVDLLGPPDQRTSSGRSEGLHYRCASARRCPILQRTNMPLYYGRYFFTDGHLAAFEGGLQYP
jgi:hypothetical protein